MRNSSRRATSDSFKVNVSSASSSASTFGVPDFTTNPIAIINEFANYLHQRQMSNEGSGSSSYDNHTALLGKFAGFLADSDHVKSAEIPGIIQAFSTALDLTSNHDCWIVDSGATDHMTNNLFSLHDFKTMSSSVSVANGKGAIVYGKGKIKLLSQSLMSDALFVSFFPFQLLSVGQISRLLKCFVIFTPQMVFFQDIITKKMIGEGFFKDGLYYLSRESTASKALHSISLQDTQVWHRRLAHPSDKVLSILFPGLCNDKTICDVCHFSKSTRLSFSPSTSRASYSFEIIHSDIWGPVKESFDGFKYFVTFIDDFTRITWIYVMKFKSELFEMFKDFQNLVTTHYSSKISILRSDNGSEYLSNKMSQFLSSCGILHQTSCVGTPQQNGLAERKNRDILEKTRALMFQMNMPKRFWSHAVLAATYLINRLPSRVIEFKSPLEKLKGRKIDLSHLKTFGCVCYVHIQSTHRGKLDPRAAKCVFLGYSSTQKGYKCYNPVTKKVIVSRDVEFEESTPYFEGNS